MVYDYRQKSSEPAIVFKKDFTRAEYTWKDVLFEFLHSRKFKAILWIAIPWIILNFWLYRWDDFQNGCHIKIGISLLEWNNLEIKDSLRFLREKSPKDYANVCKYVTRISPDLPCGGSGGGCFHPSVRKQIEISTLGHKNNPALTAAIVVHETCHSIQMEEGRPFNESECYGAMNKMLGALNIDSPWKNYQQ